ncbi:MAG: N-acetyltransferase [Vampirovibrionales bacterium]|nr:N-acetyltransferase [Vampirovibrionales bacterium]
MNVQIGISQGKIEEWPKFWPAFSAIVAAEDTYGFDPAWTIEEAVDYWFGPSQTVFFAKDQAGRILGSFYIRPNGYGPAGHVANAGFMVAPDAQGKGVGRKMGEAALKIAKEMGYCALQYNCVVSTNQNAIALWESLGFKIIGTIPEAYRHKTLGLVDAHIMYRKL